MAEPKDEFHAEGAPTLNVILPNEGSLNGTKSNNASIDWSFLSEPNYDLLRL